MLTSHYSNEHNKPIIGDFTYLFASRDRWRSDLSWNGEKATRVASRELFWRTSSEAFRPREYQLDVVMNFSKGLLTLKGGRASPPHKKDVNGVSCLCTKLSWRNFTREVCLDAGTGLPVRIRDPGIELNVEGGNYQALGLKRFPSQVRFDEQFKQVVRMDVDSLDVLESVSDATFAPLPGAEPMPWCPDEKAPRPEQGIAIITSHPLTYLSLFDTGDLTILEVQRNVLPSKFSYLDFKIGVDGGVKDLKALDRRGNLIDRDPELERLRQMKFFPAVCGDRVVEGEFALVLNGPA